jgi:acetate CoA/acetoacetate CoA-transferase alpha subunit
VAIIVSKEQALEKVKDNMTLMIGGFLAVGTPEILIDGIIKKGVRNLTVIANDTGFPDRGIGKLVVAKQIEKVIVSHVGTNPETGRQMNMHELKVELVPQGTLAEQIRAGGAGLGGVLTPTGIGTIVEDGKQIVAVDGREYILEKPLKADVALLWADVADKAGNLLYRRSSRNFNPLMAMAAETVIVAASNIVEIGEIDQDVVMTPGIFVDIIVQG